MESFKKWFVIAVGYFITAHKMELSDIYSAGDSGWRLLLMFICYHINYLFWKFLIDKIWIKEIQ